MTKLHSVKLAIPLLGVMLWVLSIHAGIFSDATLILAPPSSGGRCDYEHVDIFDAIRDDDLNRSVSFADRVVGSMKRLEDNLLWSSITVHDGTPSHGMLISFGPEREAADESKHGVTALRATNQLMNEFCGRLPKEDGEAVSQRQCARLMGRFSFRDTPLAGACGSPITCPPDAPYRSINGSCNNPALPRRGESFTGYSRLLYADYSDGVHQLRRSVYRKPLPNARKIVNGLTADHEQVPAEKATLALMQWAQFLEHDLSRSATAVGIHTDNPIECCSQEGGNLSPRYVHPFCSPIHVGFDRAYADKGVDCLNFVRSIPAIRADCTFGAADQVNQATHYLDGSQIYGSSERKSASLRTFAGGKLRTSKYGGRTLLPLSAQPTHDCQIFSKSSPCYESGDPRVNFQPQLALMHTLWYREHNRVADELAALNAHWNDETLFQEARRVVVAEMQRITYAEWLPALLGSEASARIANSAGYDAAVDGSVSNAFATAVMRSMKSLSDGAPKFYGEDREANESIFIRNYFHNPSVLRQEGVLDALARGLATQKSQKLDVYFAEDLINQLYSNGRYGFDVLSFDVERGRDHGLPGYAAYRRLCGLRKVRRFADFADSVPQDHIELLSRIYASPHDVDLLIGGLLETPEPSSLLGPTFACILSDQLARTRRADRYFYANSAQPKPFSQEQLAQLEKVSFARILCDNGDDIRRMQPDAFETIGESNSLAACDDPEAIPRPRLSPWIDYVPISVNV
ncbi:peroxidase-like isoform X2 [Cylas formicarius]|nr:peroxidase-like isoform X2 [Cylas formicarius]XP_060527406.1 peroxidase-like isoform X2 [Cylas formicarius]